MRTYLQARFDALDNLEEYIGRLQVLEDQAIAPLLSDLLALVVLLQGAIGELILLRRRMLALSKNLEKALRATRDAKLKGLIGAAPAGGAVADGSERRPGTTRR